MAGAQSHHLPLSLPPHCGRGSLAHWSVVPATHLIVFVHGFLGGPSSTWPEFPSLVTQNPALPKFDYIFYGYDAVRRQANSSAIEFAGFLDSLLNAPATLINQTIPTGYERQPFKYDRVVLVAHSLGAVITRNALLHGYRRRKTGVAVTWLDSVRLVLLAPAHHGAYAAKLAYAALTASNWSVGKLLGFVGQSRLPLLDDLQQNSAVIRALHADTSAAIADFKTAGLSVPSFIRAHGVLWAVDEYVVHNIPFFEDAPEESLHTDHQGVCKPKNSVHRALQLVWEAL